MRWPVSYHSGICTLLLGLSVALIPSQSRANSISYQASGSGSDGSLDATVTFQSVSAGTLNGQSYGGGLEISITNDLSGTDALGLSQGQAVSSLTFSLGPGYTATAFTVLNGNMFNYSGQTTWSAGDGTPITDSSSLSAIDHWGFTTGSKVGIALETAGKDAPPANPQYMIIPSSGSAATGGFDNFNPYLLGTANFFITVTGMDSSTVLSTDTFGDVSVGFGTGPDTTLSGGYVPGFGGNPTPVPASLASGLALLCGLGFIKLCRSRRSSAV